MPTPGSRTAGAFLDSNVLVYAFTTDPRSIAARALLEHRPTISVQGLNEFANVARRKLHMDWVELRKAVELVRFLCGEVRSVDLQTHIDALHIAERYGYSVYDSLIVSSALQAESPILWSEDMQDGMVIEGRLRIADPFRSTLPA